MFRSVAVALVLAAAPVFVAGPALAGDKKDKADKSDKPAEKPAETSWKKLGERSVDGKADKDVIQVGADDGFFTAIQIKVENSAIVMHEVKVVFVNGDVFEPKTKLVFSKDSSTQVIDLPGDKRVIKRVEFKYGNLPGGGKARVELWGKSAPPPVTVGKMVKLGERSVDGKIDKDIIQVGADDGAFTAIEVKVENSSLVMHEIKVVFANGDVFEPKTKLIFDKDSSTRLIDLPGNKRIIKRVEFKYGNLPGGGKAKIELWGKR